MAAPFDHIAHTYDSLFTRSVIGQLQRRHVWDYLEKILSRLDGLEMLELNCGTGEDAVMFSEKGFNIIATDVSEEMLKITQQRAPQYSMQNKISSQYLDLESFQENMFDKKFDLIFSNFGGVNCINPDSLKMLLERIPNILNPHGRFVAVIMPKFCWWESLYFSLRFNFSKAFRRWTSKEVMTDLDGTSLKTWYYHPSQIKRWAKDGFKLVSTKPIGLVLPPTYLENFFTRNKRILLTLNLLEKRLNRLSFYSGMADNYIIDLELK